MITILQGDVVEQLKTLPDKSVHCTVTSPPYYGLRNYGVEGQIGLEKTPEEYVQKLVEVFREVRRVLRDDGTLWLNLGDSYAGGGGSSGHTSETKNFGRTTESYGAVATNGKVPNGLKPKDLCMIPARVALALQADGWWLRSQIPWLKRNSMPESCNDRPSSAVEYIYLLTKSKDYFYDIDAIRVKYSEAYLTENRPMGVLRQRLYPDSKYLTCEYGSNQFKPKNLQRGDPNTMHKAREMARNGTNIIGHSGNYNADGECLLNPEGRNRRNSDWFFESWQGLYSEDDEPLAMIVNPQARSELHFATFPDKLVEPCIKAGCPVDGTVLDPFGGSGTTGDIARELKRDCILIELNPEYIKIMKNRLRLNEQLGV